MYKLLLWKLGGTPLNVTFWRDSIKLVVTSLYTAFQVLNHIASLAVQAKNNLSTVLGGSQQVLLKIAVYLAIETSQELIFYLLRDIQISFITYNFLLYCKVRFIPICFKIRFFSVKKANKAGFSNKLNFKSINSVNTFMVCCYSSP